MERFWVGGEGDFREFVGLGFFSQSQKRLPNPGFLVGGLSIGFYYPLTPLKVEKMCILYSF